MARAGRKDRGLLSKLDSAGKLKWYARLYNEGKEKRFGPFKDKTEARHFYDQAKLEQRQGQFFPEQYRGRHQPEPILLQDYIKTWLASRPMKGLKPSTIEIYGLRIGKRILPTFGLCPLPSIDRSMVKAWVVKMVEEGLDYDTTLSYLVTLSGVLTEAVEDGLILVNPAHHAGKILKRPNTLEEKALEIFTPEEERAFLATVKEYCTQFYPMALTFFRTGMRAGEVMGLHREDLDFRARSIFVRRTWSRARIGTPKNGKGRRIDMSMELATTLETWIATQSLESAAAGQPLSQIVFPGNVGGLRRQPYYMAEHWLRDHLWYPLVEKAKVRRLNPHAARHTFASRLIANNENLKYVSEQLGHSSINITADTYGHLIPGTNKRAVDRLDDVKAYEPRAVQEVNSAPLFRA
jgi:integrase